MKFILADKTQFDIVSFTRPLSVAMVVNTMDDVTDAYDSMTSEALATATVVDGDTTLATFHDVAITGVQCVVNPGNTITAHFYFTANQVDPADADPDYTMAAKILLGEVE